MALTAKVDGDNIALDDSNGDDHAQISVGKNAVTYQDPSNGDTRTFVRQKLSGSGSTSESGLIKAAAVKKAIHDLQDGLDSYYYDNDDTYPYELAQSTMSDPYGGSGYVDPWPTNPYTGAPMTEGTDPGDYSYTNSDDGSYELVGYGSNGEALITVPSSDSGD